MASKFFGNLRICTLLGCLCGLPLAASASLAANDGTLLVFSHSQTVTFDQMIESLSRADVVFVGEQHDHKRGHELELEVLKAIYAKNSSIALSLEMFERDVQMVLDEYLSDQISESSFLAASRPWPRYKTDYAPLVEFCKKNKLPVIAANAPRRYVSMVTRKGQSSLLDLRKEARSNLPRLPYSMVVPEGYDKALDEVFSNHGSSPAAAVPSPSRMKESQMLWDATMADSVLRARSKTHAKVVLQMNGAMHSDSGYGIVDRLRQAAPRLRIVTVSIKTDDPYPNVDRSKYDKTADFVIVTPPDAADPAAKKL